MQAGTIWKRVAGVAFGAALLGQTAFTPAVAEDKAASETGDPAIWKVADEDTTVYLFGTVHLLAGGVKWQSDDFKSAFEASPVLYLEADVSPQAQQEIQSLIPQYGLNEPGVTLTSQLSEEGVEALRKVTSMIGMPVEAIEPFRPWLAGIVISAQLVAAQGGTPDYGVEAILTRLATEDGKEFRYFETAGGQIEILAGVPDEKMAASFERSMDQIVENPDMFNDLVQAWVSGDTDALDRLVTSDIEQFPEVYDALFTNRNKAWVEELTRLMEEDEGTFFVGVGAGHLVGKDSVQVYLAEEGYDAERQ